MSDKLFIYGSLSEGMVYFGQIQNFIETMEKVDTKGAMYRLPVGYPVFSDEGEHSVGGHLVELKSNDTLWILLDDLHGVHKTQPEKGLHFKKMIQVRKADGSIEECIAYVVNPAKMPAQCRPIENSNWMDDIKAEPPMTESLSEPQIKYLKKLGQSSGRDIIPIKLELYRELMKLELIVDKGRRLALSKFGKEVYRYL